MHRLIINNFGPLQKCEVPIYDILAFTGPQASGKSTIVRSIYFFRTIKNELLDIIAKDDFRVGNANLEHELRSVLKEKLKNLFGPSFAMSSNLKLQYFFTDSISATVTLTADKYFNIEFSNDLQDCIFDIEQATTAQMTTKDYERISRRISQIFDDNKEVVFVPAGRSMITLLTDVLNYFMLQADKEFQGKIDYSTSEFLRHIIKTRPFFAESKFSFTPEQNELKSTFNLIRTESESLLGGVYKYENYEERLYYSKSKYVKINFSSSGQQEALWLLNTMQYLTYKNKDVLFIVEEPEAHLYPDAQAKIIEILSVFAQGNNSAIITTHSPYILAELNVLLLCGKLSLEDVKEKIHKRKWINPNRFGAFHIADKKSSNALSETDGLIINELIDHVSEEINEKFDWLFDKLLHRNKEGE